ncbi:MULTISPECIES: PfkB family carbohydrate kinase [unclassified Sedimentibacter]|uniref:PfkB family carbohydrate kinase n=1 Tax=unclassified Sedimentibacter TaxID=2649220 RepID=UPI0027E16901|nr:PfkB family carbohydrate kinase [Sedimentibacter sp. MB35-C1]WMJ76343.1 PfkB family carbohydrate kinase [Sedimentibacter sp. MB35-C1]
MTNREQEIFDLIKKNPMISQNEIGELLGITRSSVAVHITNLIKKGKILGKGYVVKENPYVTVIGGVNIDIHGIPKNRLIPADSNIGIVKMSLGGVGRNIGENLVRLGIDTKLISVLGDDIYGSKILEESADMGLDMKDCLILKGESTSTYLAVLDETHDMSVAISSMDIYERMTVEFIKEKKHVIDNSELCVLDTNVPLNVIEYLLSNHRNTDFFLDTVSTAKAKKVKNLLGSIHTLKTNRIEAEAVTGIEINCEDGLKRNFEYLLSKGIKRVFITFGKKGVFYSDGSEMKRVAANHINPVNTTGAGDAFMAALVYSHINNKNINESAAIATAASVIALSHENTINPNMSVESINSKVKELKLC